VRRPRRLGLIAVAVAVFGLISFGLARWLSTETEERNQIAALLRAQARGDARGMLGELAPRCGRDASCRAQVESNAARLRRPGEVKILAYRSATSYALGGARGTTRVAWTIVDRGLPVVQCVAVRRDGTALSGRSVELLSISAPIGREKGC
jgi:hypothetical protein